ncbi:nucleotidyl transferase AbiEii/AbiGii toxin family protein [Roseiflexus castenholzii]|uniref:Uncharacterized protein n=1 Tax=Roseiflexus castenholzii (strain DSM 13941 / HLO8) TaxID=383372 RepID=A7NM66_ROSCS|nr:nucleotidyl transferase AbiEii/AbiGii toxin family protein [Roseiflexus castenholzii]ABU58621.1 hypothetical protein Rcas_2542 [Roseiflexus castenholzii DSM 13941]
MQVQTFWKIITMDAANLLEQFIAFLREQGIRFCVIGGQAVNAYVEPLVSLDLVVVVAVESLDALEQILKQRFIVRRFPHSLNIALPHSDLRIQIQTDERYRSFIDRAVVSNVLGVDLPVASLEDVLRGKIWATLDPERSRSKRQKDLADIARLIEAYPHLSANVPEEILARLE